MISIDYLAFSQQLAHFIPPARIISDYSKRFAYGTDASFYRLTPELVVQIDSEKEMIELMVLANQARVPLTFRAAGTSLSGQALSDSVLVLLTTSWREHKIIDLGQQIKLGPGVIGSDANKYLAPYGRKLGPDPASINTCKIGGIAANNSGGMCCGVAQNSYHTLASIRVVLFDGTVLDTGEADSVAQFRLSHQQLLAELKQLSSSALNDQALSQLIRHKYRLKNTTGYAINSLIDFDDAIDILAHLMIGSEGTLGFISSITYNTVVEHKYRASSFILFPDIDSTCKAVTALSEVDVAAVELLDRRALYSVRDMDGLPPFMLQLAPNVAALLVEVRAENKALLQQKIDRASAAIANFDVVDRVEFTSDALQYSKLWAIRKQTFPAVGAVRPTGTTVIIEDVAFPVKRLSQGVSDLSVLFEKYHYDEAIIFGHALDGNLHFVFTQDFSTAQEVKRYQLFMDDVCQLVAVKYQGSLKAEHGTGRNMAPYVELEWGKAGYRLMQRIKLAFDPQNIINPGVIINDNSNAHISDLKPLPPANEIIDKCIECGFCEPVCPSNGLSLTPRQRITTFREMNRLRRSGEAPQQLAQLEQDFQYLGVDTCAATGLCEQRCPVGINTGDFVREIRANNNVKHQKLAARLANNFSLIEQTSRVLLATAGFTQRVIGDRAMTAMTSTLRKLSGHRIPKWSRFTPTKAHYQHSVGALASADCKVVYMPSCASRNMGQALGNPDQRSLTQVTLSLLQKAGIEVISPDFSGQCCGMPFHSKGQFTQAEKMRDNLAQRLLTLSDNGAIPILFDTSPCKSMMLDQPKFKEQLSIYEPVAYTQKYLSNKLRFKPVDETVMLHVTCTSSRMGLAEAMTTLANLCATNVVVPEHISCCGFAGDKGFTLPELNANALAPLKAQIPKGCNNGYSNSRTCEIGLSTHSGIDYQSILYLVDRATKPRATKTREP